MKAVPLSRRDRLRQILADLRMPGALEALDAILQGVDGGTLTASDAIEQLLTGWIFEVLPRTDEEFERAKDLIVEAICGGLENGARDQPPVSG